MTYGELRRVDKAMDQEASEALLKTAMVGRIGTVGADGWPYVVPNLFVYEPGTIWFHTTAARGHLRQNVEETGRASFEVDEPGEVFPYGPTRCDTSVGYRSVIAFGPVAVVSERAAKIAFYDRFLAKYGADELPRGNAYPRLDATTVYALRVERMTGKVNDAYARPHWRPEGHAADAMAVERLEGETIRLERLRPDHGQGLLEAGRDSAIWAWMPLALTTPEALAQFLEQAQEAMKTGRELVFAVIGQRDGRVLGSTRYMDIQPAHRTLEIGWTWYTPEVWQTRTNPEAKALLLSHAFDAWGARRVTLKTDHENSRSQAAIRKLGAVYEGTLRNHRIRPDGTQRHTALFSITREEWPGVRAQLATRLAALR